jgi:hypothetical protein
MIIRGSTMVMVVIAIVCTSVPIPMQSDSEVAGRKTVPTGVWGGEHIRMEINQNGAEIDFDCATGAIANPILLDAKGRFRLVGTYKTEHPAPVQSDGASGFNAVYSGTLHGDRLRLEVTVSGVEGVKSFDLVKGDQGTLAKCA